MATVIKNTIWGAVLLAPIYGLYLVAASAGL